MKKLTKVSIKRAKARESHDNHKERHGFVGYFRLIKPKWKIPLDEKLNELRLKNDMEE